MLRYLVMHLRRLLLVLCATLASLSIAVSAQATVTPASWAQWVQGCPSGDQVVLGTPNSPMSVLAYGFWSSAGTATFDALGPHRLLPFERFYNYSTVCTYTVVNSPGCKVERRDYRSKRAEYLALRRQVKALRVAYQDARRAYRAHRTDATRNDLQAATAALVDPVANARAAQSKTDAKFGTLSDCVDRLNM